MGVIAICARKEVLIMDSISKINEDFSIKIPAEILEKAGLKPGAEIVWLYDRQGQILLMEKPNSFAKTMKGLGKDMDYNIEDVSSKLRAKMNIKEIHSKKQKVEISTNILETLPNWFGIPESTQEYIDESSSLPFFAIFNDTELVDFIAIKENNKYTVEIYVMGVHPNCHRQGIGRALISRVIEWSKEKGYEFIQVKTLDESHPDIHYAKTREFYLSIGFRPLESIPELWGKDNPCLTMVQHL